MGEKIECAGNSVLERILMSTHIVRQGECLSSIAYSYGYNDWRTIYNHPENSDFKAKRPNPNLIYPNDRLFIPDQELKEENCSTEQLHVFEVDLNPTYLNVCLQHPVKQPVANASYRLTFGSLNIEDKTNSEGWIKKKIPPNAEMGKLTVWLNQDNPEAEITWNVKLGHLDPLDTTTGVKGRLSNLAYDCGTINDEENAVYEAAVRKYQEDHNLTVDGIVGPQTRGSLEKEHRV